MSQILMEIMSYVTGEQILHDFPNLYFQASYLRYNFRTL